MHNADLRKGFPVSFRVSDLPFRLSNTLPPLPLNIHQSLCPLACPFFKEILLTTSLPSPSWKLQYYNHAAVLMAIYSMSVSPSGVRNQALWFITELPTASTLLSRTELTPYQLDEKK